MCVEVSEWGSTGDLWRSFGVFGVVFCIHSIVYSLEAGVMGMGYLFVSSNALQRMNTDLIYSN